MIFFSSFFKGFTAPIQAVGLIFRSPKLVTLVAVPLAINLALYAFFIYYGSVYLSGLIEPWNLAAAHSLPPWAASLSHGILKVFTWLTLALVSALSFTFVSGIVSAPFNDALSRAAVRLRLKQTSKPHFSDEIHLPVSTTVLLEMRRMAVLVLGTLAALILGVIPFLQIPALMLGAFVVSFEYFGYPVSQRSQNLLPVFWFSLRQLPVTLGFGSMLLLIMAVPFASALYIPLAVVGGSMLYADFAPRAKMKSTS